MADWNICAGCGEEMPDLMFAQGDWWCTMPCKPESKGPGMKEFDVVVYLNDETPGSIETSKTITIRTDHDLTLGDEEACEIVEEKCEELGLLSNEEDYLGGGTPVELNGFDIVEPPHGHVVTQVIIPELD